tara:strand:- start:109638 stop:109925 length:288 start_codon:yes stop_codon:yes gene_type:complete
MSDDQGEGVYCLINGDFFPDEAKDLLMALIEDKIRFHRRNSLSRHERLGETETAGLKRIGQLQKTKANLIQRLDGLSEDGQKLHINCNIEITLAG